MGYPQSRELLSLPTWAVASLLPLTVSPWKTFLPVLTLNQCNYLLNSCIVLLPQNFEAEFHILYTVYINALYHCIKCNVIT